MEGFFKENLMTEIVVALKILSDNPITKVIILKFGRHQQCVLPLFKKNQHMYYILYNTICTRKSRVSRCKRKSEKRT